MDRGKRVRLGRILTAPRRRTLIVPLDDSLLAGPEGGLRHIAETLDEVVQGHPDATIGFPGLYIRVPQTMQLPGILNVTASTTRSHHTKKTIVGSVEQAVELGLDGVAVHVNLTSEFEGDMIAALGTVARDCDRYGMPLLAIMYPRREENGADDNYVTLRSENPAQYTELVRHAVRVGVELGADIVKTQFTGSVETFRSVVESSCGVPLVVAGGPLTEAESALQVAAAAIEAGASGVSFGRNVFNREQGRVSFLHALRRIVHETGSFAGDAVVKSSDPRGVTTHG